MPIRAKNKASIAEDINHIFEELWGVEEDDIPHKIFTRKANKQRVDDVLTLTKYDVLTLSWRDDSGNVAILRKVDAGRVRMLLHFKIILSDKGSHPIDGSFRHTSVTTDDHDAFKENNLIDLKWKNLLNLFHSWKFIFSLLNLLLFLTLNCPYLHL